MKSIHIITRIFLTIAIFMVSTIFVASAQNGVSVTQNKYAFKGDSVFVDLVIELNNTSVSKRSSVLLTPVIQKDDKSLDLPAVVINGKNRQKTYLRMVALKREPEGVAKVIDAKNAGAEKFYYSVVVPREPWMKDANFVVREEQCKCNGPLVMTNFDLISGKMKDMNPLHFLPSYREPNPEPVKMRSETGKSYLDFIVSKADLNPDFSNNAFELAKIGDIIMNMKVNPDIVTITEIIIDGYASPEGSFDNNLRLSNSRVAALKNYLRIKYRIGDKLFKVKGHGEDWATLEELISKSDLEYRDEALEIIRNTTNPDEREQKLKLLKGGTLYKELLEAYYPMLRRADYELRYTVVPFTVEEGKKTLESKPSLLSLNEMFLIAQTYPAGSAEFRNVFDIAVRTYPSNEIANFNAAANALDVHDLNAAEKYMNLIKTHDAAYNNNLGILSALKGDHQKAIELFHRAMDGGNIEASQNLREVDKLIEGAPKRGKNRK